MFTLSSIFMILVFLVGSSWAESLCVKVIDGERIYTNLCGKEFKKPAKTKKAFQLAENEFCREELEKIAEEKSRLYGVDPKLIKEMIREESGWNPNAISPKGAMGVMQLMPQTATLMGVKNPFDPVENIDGGVRYMKYLLEKFNGNVSFALAAYNAGPTVVETLGRIPNISETQNYVRRISYRYSGSPHQSFKKPSKIKAVVLPDGTIIYTNREDLYIWTKTQQQKR